MQRNSVNRGKLSVWGICTILIAGLATMLAGCTGGGSSTGQPKARQPFADVTLTVHCSDRAIGALFVRRTAAWQTRTGAVVKLAESAESDIAIIPPRELGSSLAGNNILPVSEDLLNTAHSVQWTRLLAIWSERLATWGGVPYGIPLAGESYVLVYDVKKFAQGEARFQRAIQPPATWEEYAELAELFARDGKPSLPVVPADAEQSLREFHFIAACYDRPALTGTDFNAFMQKTGNKDAVTAAMLSFHHNLTTGEPQLNRAAFIEAARLIKRLAACRAKEANQADDPISSVVNGGAVMAIVSLTELGRMSKIDGAAPATIGIAPLPGTKVWFDPKTGEKNPPADAVRNLNYVPYLGSGGWIGVVRKECRNPAAAFEMLAEISSLDRSTELISDPAIGCGPFRVEHLDASRESIWQRYGFDSERSRKLAIAIRLQLGTGLANPVIGLRGADRTELIKLLAIEVSKLSSGSTTPESAMQAADAAWRQADAARPADVLRTERLRAASLR